VQQREEPKALQQISKALVFAAHKHAGQRRADAEATPYINHPIALLNILLNEGGISDADVLVAAILHDTIEDTDTSREELEQAFGSRVAGLVLEVTDDQGLSKQQRKRRQIEHAPHLTPAARLLKLADKIANLRDITNIPPVGWTPERKRGYYDWAKQVIDGLRGTHAALEALFDAVYQQSSGCFATVDQPGSASAASAPETGSSRPADSAARRKALPVICYDIDQLPSYDEAAYRQARQGMQKIDEIVVPPRDAVTFEVPAGHLFRVVSVEGPQVGDLNLWHATDLSEHFFSGKTRQLHATHLTTGDRLWSSLPGLRPMATITRDTLDWYGWDDDGAGVHDVIGTRCDPYTNHLLKGVDYDRCCHSNLTRALAVAKRISLDEAERHVHDVLNLFMCTGFTRDRHQYFMKASPVRPGDYIELFAEIDLLGALSTCPGGDCGSTHSDDATACYPLLVEIYRPAANTLSGWQPPSRNGYRGRHGIDSG